MAIKGIIFDMDGVIIDSERLHDIVAHEFFAARGLQYDRDFLKPLLMGKSSHEVAKIQKEYYNIDDDIESMVAEKYKRLGDIIDEQLVYIPGFLEYHRYLQKIGIPTVVATGSSSSILDKVDKKLGIKELFSNKIITVDQVGGVGKPNPAIFLGAMKLLGLEGKDCLIIEDAPNGIEAAKAAGAMVIGLATTLGMDVLANSEPDYIVAGFDDVTVITTDLCCK